MLGVSRYQGCDRSVSGVSPAVVVGTKVVLSNEHFVIFQVQVFCETKYKQLWVSRVHRDCSFSCHTFSVVVALFQRRIQGNRGYCVKVNTNNSPITLLSWNINSMSMCCLSPVPCQPYDCTA